MNNDDDSMVRGFDSMEEAFAFMANNESQANEGLLAEQIELRDDIDNVRFWVQPYKPMQCLIFGRVFSQAEREARSLEYVNQASSEASRRERQAEANYEIEVYRSSRQRGYLFGKAFSNPFPEGELGDTHVSQVWPISEQAFNEAEAHDWKAVTVDTLTALMLPVEVVAEKTTPTLNAELLVADQRIQQSR